MRYDYVYLAESQDRIMQDANVCLMILYIPA